MTPPKKDAAPALTIHPKVAGSSLSGALAIVILWAISFAVDVPPEVAAAFTAILSFIGGWLAPAR